MEIILVLIIVAFGGALLQIGFLQSENRALRAMLDHHHENTAIRLEDLVTVQSEQELNEQPMPRHAQSPEGQHRSH